MRVLPAAAALFIALACVAGAGATGSTSPSAYASEYVSVMDQITSIVVKDRGNCAKMASDLQAFSNSNKSKIAQLDAEGPKFTTAEKLAVGMKVEGTVESDTQKIAQNVLTCATNKQVAAALSAASKLEKS